ncbi:MAG: Stk1 family PASTA domain-containing Ser/Thr kinase [Lachnospiraceae bacterium]|nr:Stk1 family PASTA domain-containing Ser/Thr kinase [Lachnospiraceae bacterium]
MLNTGTIIAGRYEILEKIGAGGMSDVYKAMDHSLGREVAIKVLKQEFIEDAGFVSKFRAEAQSAAGLEHPNIVNIYDVGSEEGLYYIVMEYVEGITLKTYISKKGRLSYNELISIAIQVGRGIEAAHNKNIIHRDIKPQNIIISKEGKVKVTDFGIARAATANTINADIMGSVHYSSPEQARNGYVTFQSDIYSLGIVMYEMCTGRVPYDGDTTVAIAIQHLQGEMTPPSTYAPDVPISVERIIQKATMKSQDKRYATMDEMLTDLKKALVNPNEDFVTIASEEGEKTKVVTEEELNQIQKQAGIVDVSELASNDGEEWDDEEWDDEYDEEYDDEEDGSVNPKMEKAITILGIVAAVIIGIVVLYLLGHVLGIFKFGGKNKDADTDTKIEQQDKDADTSDKVTVPDLLGMTEEEAKAELKKLNLGYKNAGTASSDKYEEGQVMSQSINAGQKVEKNSTITVTISSGAGNIDVPNVENMTESAATNTLTDAGFKYSVSYNYSDSVEQGVVISQTPGAKASGKKGDTIALVVSRGKETVTVPDVTNKSQADATNALAAVGLTVSGTTENYSDSIAAGNVISQNVSPGSTVDKGSGVAIEISKGKKPLSYVVKFKAPANESTTTKKQVEKTNEDGTTTTVEEEVKTPITTYTFTAVSNNGTTLATGSLAAGADYEFSVDNTSEEISSVVVTFTESGTKVNASVSKK